MTENSPVRNPQARLLLVVLLLSLSVTFRLNAKAQASPPVPDEKVRAAHAGAMLTPTPAPAPATTTTTTAPEAGATPAAPAATETAATEPKPAAPAVSTTSTASLTAAASTAARAVAPKPLPSTSDDAELTLSMRVVFTNIGTTEVRSGYVDVPLLADLRGSTQKVVSATITPQPIETFEDGMGNRVGRFDLASIPAGGGLVIHQEYRLAYAGTPHDAASAGPRPEHLSSEPKIETDAPPIQALASQFENSGDTLAVALKIAAKTRSLIKYDAASSARNQGALAALEAGSGICEEFACLFAALCRAAGLPSRVIHGFARDRDSSRSAWTGVAGAGVILAPYRHAWAEVYLDGLGWVAVDPTYNRSALDSVATRAIAPGTYVSEGYASSPVTGRYVGGKLQAERKETLSW